MQGKVSHLTRFQKINSNMADARLDRTHLICGI